MLTLAGRPSVGRFGASILHAVGLDDWVTTDADSYVARAVAAASDPASLARLHAELRGRFLASPLHDATGLARAVEAAYRALWEEWNACDPTELQRRFAAGDLAAAGQLAERMLARNPSDPDAAHVAGLIAHREQRLAEADHHLRTVLAATPDNAEALANHAAILRGLGRLTEAEAAAHASLTQAPDRPETLNNLGNILRDAGRYPESIAAFQQALQHNPRFADAWVNLAWVLSLQGLPAQAEQAARRAIACDPRNANGHNNLGLALMRQSRLREAEAALRQALALRPDFALPHSNVLFCLNYRDDISAESIFAEYRAWDERHARGLLPAPLQHALDRTPGRRLRVGYVSPDFRQHAVALFAEPLLAAHDRQQVELFCYAELPVEDATTQRIRTLVDHWRPTVGLTDAAMAALIRQDRIDVLVDLAGHTAGNRMLVFARKPAPVQIEYILGHGYTSGLSAMDAFLADEHLAPPGAEALFSEPLIRLPRIPLAYRPPDAMPSVAPLPAMRSGAVTFGYFGRTVRLNEAVIAAWSRILLALPDARLVLNSAPFAEPAARADFAARFAAQGVAASRLTLICTTPQPRTWAAYGEIDIALDPFPHNAGTTTIEALYQGVPVLTLAGRPSVGRFGASILHAVGLDDWVTGDPDSYVARAVAAASDLEDLAALRAGLRERFLASPLSDAAGLARSMEAAYRDLWDTWREGPVPCMQRLYAAGE
ncbi:MAG TPA: tetratricopeptide repeat protein, partial [Acetobacteraceae bacterium]|nr:tetratricopeptide repeat protein [Acetobacteraceae bacterium]